MKTWIAVLAALLAVPAAAERTHTVVPKDCLWDLAKHYYQNPFRWRAIHAANTNIVKDPHWIYPKQVLIIPDLPDASVGELPARPVETQPAPTVEPEVAEAQPVDVEPAPQVKPEEEPVPEKWKPGLSRDLPEGLAGGYPSMKRVKVEKTWKEDGKIIEFEGREIMAAQGDVVQAKLPSARPGETYLVYRKVAAHEEEDPKGTYLQTVGLVRVDESVGKQAYRLTILKSGDAVQLGDLLKRSGS